MTKSLPAVRLRSRMRVRGINPYVQISARQAVRLGKHGRRPIPVRVQVNGKPELPWRINLMPRGDGSFFLYLAGPIREASGTKVGDIVTVRLQFDAEYRNGPIHPIPKHFRHQLESNRPARMGWERLPPSRQKEILRYLAGLKSTEALRRNVSRAVAVLAGVRARFMARDWNAIEVRKSRR
jgi:hypothetical protein